MAERKITGGVYSDVSDQVTQICETCKWASPFHTVGYVICFKKGLVPSDFVCKKYDYNRLLKRPSKKRALSEGRFSADDFSID